MVKYWGLLTCAVLAAVVVATPAPYVSSSLRVHEARDTVPVGFVNAGPAPLEKTLKLRFALAQSTPDAIVDALFKVSDPTIPEYGQHLSKAEVEQLVAPSSAAVNAVNAWLTANNLEGTTLSPAGDWVGFEIPVAKANSLFSANFSVFEYGSSGKQAIRTMSYSLPAGLQCHVDLVHPTTSFPSPASKAQIVGIKSSVDSILAKRNVTQDCTDETIPECVQFLYDIPLTPATNSSNRLGVTGRTGNSAHFSFLQQFLTMFRPDMNPTTNFSVVGIDGGTNPQQGPSVSEGELDIQYTVGIATDVPVTYYFIGEDFQDGDLEGFLDEVNVILSEENPPHVLTTSYGMPSETDISFALTDKLCKAYAQMGARGVSVLYASGDSGVGCPSGSDDLVFQATFPSNCPYVTSVGGTQGFPDEEAWRGSSGGFSNYFARPAYQDDAVNAFLAQLGDKNANATFNRTGRAFPDISAKADGYIIFAAGLSGITGTSASSPVTASVIALLNDRLAVAGRPPLGFLNPWLYSVGKSALHDIVSGNSSVICESDDPVPRGFDAAPGWDPVTGLGTPNFPKLLALLGL
ncbi:subtilisin-like protein [Lenzites betulinus]|nr:subtilisin-like protein [Lenzites betulinus]